MARTITDEEIKLSIVINGNPAQKQLLDLEKATRKLTEENKGLYLEKKRLEALGEKESDQYKKLTADIKANSQAIDNNKATMKELQNQIGITGLTMKQLTDKAHLLKMTLRNLVPGSADYKRYTDELSQVNSRIGELNGRSTQAGSSIGNLADKFNRYSALGASVLGVFAGMVVSVQKIIDLNGKLSDAQANVMKTTGMTKDEVDELTKSFGALKTRTGRIELLGIAESGGRLGIAKNEIQDFVKVMDKAGVALGDSFEGGAEVVSDKLGKIKGLYDDLSNATVETAFESVGSALNDLGASGAASEENISEFVTRVGAMPEAFKPSIGTALGLGAAFEESGLKAEVAAGNYSKVISIAANNAAGFAQVMGKSKKEVEDLLKTNPNEFFLQFAESLKGMNAIDLAKTLDALKLNDNEVKMVLGAAGKNADLFREKIDLANRSLIDATSLTKEFEIKNNNLAATLDKIKKSISGLFSSDTFVKWLTTLVNWFAKFIGVVDDADGSVVKWKYALVNLIKIISLVVVAMTSYNTAMKLAAIWSNGLTSSTALLNVAQKANALTGGILKAVYLGLQYVYYTLTMQTEAATVAQKAFSLATKMNPIGLLVGVIAAAAAAFVLYNKELSTSEIKERNLAEVRQNAANAVAKEKETLENLLLIARDETLSKKDRLDAIKKINEISPEYLGNLTLETINTMAAKNAIDQYVDSLDKKAMKQAFESKRAELAKKELDAMTYSENRYLDSFLYSQKMDFLKFFKLEEENTKEFKKLTAGWSSSIFSNYRSYKNEILEARKEKLELKAQEKAFIKANAKLYTNDESTPVVPGTPISKPTKETKASDDKKAEFEKRLEDLKKQKEELIKLEQETELIMLGNLSESYSKQVQLEDEHYKQKVANLKSQLISEDDIKGAFQKSTNKKLSSAERNYWEEQANVWLAKNNHINNQIETNLLIHNKNLIKIQEKSGLEEIEKLKDKYEQEKLVRETAFLNELNNLNLSEEEKAKRKKQFEANENKHLEESYKNQIVLLENMINDVDFSGIDFSLLTPEDEEKLKEKIQKIQNALAKIKESKDSIAGNSDKEIGLNLGTNSDILGFSQEQWNNFYKNIDSGKIGIETMAFAVFALKNAFVEVDKLVSQSEAVKLKNYQRDADARKKGLKRQLDAGFLTQEQYNKRVERIDEDLDNKKFAIELKQAKRQKLLGAMNVLQSTAQAIMGIWAQVPKFDFGISAGLLTGVVAGIGAIQLASVLKAPMPTRGAEEGYYPNLVRREQDNKLFKTTGTSKMQTGLFSKPRLLVGEGPGDMPEMVIDKKAFAQISPETKAALLREISTVKGFENGYYNKDTFYTGTPNTTSQSNTNDDVVSLLKMALTVVAQNTEVMNDIKENGMAAYVSNKDFKSMKNLQKGMKEYNELISNSKVS